MNKERRKEIDASMADIESLRGMWDGIVDIKSQLESALQEFSSKLDDIDSTIQSIRDSEQESYDNSPEGLQNGDRGQAMLEAVRYLDNASNAIQEFVGYAGEVDLQDFDFDSLIGDLDSAKAQ